MRRRIVLDTNVYVSRFLREQSIPGQAVARAWAEAITLVSVATLEELREVLMREKFARYIRRAQIDQYVTQVWNLGLEIIEPPPIAPAATPKTTSLLKSRYTAAPTPS